MAEVKILNTRAEYWEAADEDALPDLLLECNIKITLDQQMLIFSIGKIGESAKILKLPIATPVDGQSDNIHYVDLAAKNVQIPKDFLGFNPTKNSGTPSRIQVEIRDGATDETSPFCTIMFTWKVSAEASKDIKLSNGETINAGASTTIEVTAGMAIIEQDSDGLSNLMLRFGVETLGVDSGWMPLSAFDLGFWSEYEMPGFMLWMADLVKLDLGQIKLPELDWNVDLPIEAKLPLGLEFKTKKFSITGTSKNYRLTAKVSNLVLSWNGKEVSYDGLAMELVWDGSKYTFQAQLATFQYPKEIAEAGTRFGFSLPFELLKIDAECWHLSIGLFKTAGGAFCIDTVLEIGDFKIGSAILGDEMLYSTDLRLHLRGLTVMTVKLAKPDSIKFFGKAKNIGNVFSKYQTHKIPAMSFAKSLGKEPEIGEKNEYGLTFLDGAFVKGERIMIAWKQTGNQLIKALAHDILGHSASGKIPQDAESYKAAIEVAWFPDEDGAKRPQIRLDWKPDTDTGGKEVTIAPAAGASILPVANDSSFTATLGERPYSFDLPGITMKVARPEVQSLIYRREASGQDSISYLLLWPTNAPELTNDPKSAILADLSVGFSTKSDEGGRQVQDSGDSKPFLRLALGRKSKTDLAVRVIGWRSGDGPEFFRFYNGKIPELLLGNTITQQADECPLPSTPREAPIDLGFDSFEGLSLIKDGSDWRLLVEARADEAISKLFGGGAVTFKIGKIQPAEDGDSVQLETSVAIKISKTVTVSGTINFSFNLTDLSVRIEEGVSLGLDIEFKNDVPQWATTLGLIGGGDNYLFSDPITILDGLELTGIIEKPDDPKLTKFSIFEAALEDGRFVLRVPDNADIVLRNDDVGEGLTFQISELEIGPSGLDLTAALVATKLKLPGLKKEFLLEHAGLRIVDGKMQNICITGSGQLPELLNEAPVKISLALKQNAAGRIVMSDFDCTLGNGKSSIISRGTRFKFDLTQITIGIDNANGTAQPVWRFLISGSMSFVPNGAEFLGGALENLQSATLEFVNAPLGDEFFKHIEFSVALVKPYSFPVFGLFDMEIRSIGFHPAFGPFGEKPAIIIGGQVKFADVGDAVSADITFHKMYIGFPKQGEILPQFHFKGLRIEIAASGFKIAGEVQHIDNAKMKGFAGFGTIMIPGMPELTAAFAFTKLRAAETDSWKRGWFIALEASRISFQMGPLPLYLRQIGLGFGYRYTSVIIKRFEEEDRLGPLVALMKKEVNNHQTLANLNSWAPDAERDGARGRWSIGIEAVFSMTSANSGPFTYEEKAEEQMRSFVAQMLIFLRSDLTFLAAAKVWFPISADDFFKNKYDMRRRPLGLGFMIYSAPKKRLLIHVAKGKNPYLGPPGKPVPDIVKNVLDQSHFEATFLSEPGLLHAELGWPDRLFFKFELGGLTLECRGGVLFRAERGMLVQGIYFSATGNADMGGGLSIGIVGVRVSAKINVSLAMRLMIGINLTKPLQSTIYAVVGFAVTVHFSIHAWFRLNLRFCKISIDLYFPLDLQITVLVELGWAGGTNLGFRIRATLMISIFGRGLHVKVALAVRPDDVNQARIRMEPYMRSYMEPGAIPPIPGLTTQENIQGLRQREKAELIRSDALLSIPRATDSALESYMLDDSPDTVSPVGITPMPPTAKQNTQHIDYDFALAMSRGQTKTRSGERLWFGWIIPSPKTPAFYPIQNEANATYAQLSYTQNKRAKIYQPVLDNKTLRWVPANGTVSMAANLDSKTELKNEDGTPYSGGSLTLRNQLAGCHIPVKEKHYRNGDSEPFPQNIAKNTPIMAPPAEFVGVLRDDRLDTPGSDAQNPRRQLERNRHKFDDLLLDSVGQRSLDDTGDAFGEKTNFAEKAKRQLTDQARGTQSYLLRAFADDLKRIIETTGLSEDGKPLATSFDGLGRPTIADLGLVFCVVAEECPDWLLSPLTANPAKLKFTEIQQIDEKDSKYNNNDQIIRPVIDFEKIDFELSPPSLSGKTRSHMDDDSLHFGWDLDWGVRGRPVNSENEPTDFTIEDFLLGYEIIITRAGQREPVDHVVVGPADLLVGLTKDKRIENNGADKIRLKGAYQYNRQLEEIGIDISREFSTELNLTAHITPISQDGTTGQPFSITTTHRPSTRPLPPDDVKLELMLRKKAAMKDNGKGKSEKLPVGLSGQITWRVLALPDSALVARTARWDLILRPIDQLPPGAYPAEATDPDDAVLSGPEGVKLLDGDLIVVLPDSMLSKSSQQDVATSNQSTEQKDPETAERDPALYTISVSLPQPSFNYEVYDHNGQQLPQKDPRRAKALKFFSGQVSNTKDGAGWHLFLRSSAELAPKAGDTFLEDRAVSALVRVQMSLRSDKTDQNIATGIRPLQHLEWVKKPVPLAQVEKSWIDSDQGPLHHAAMEIVDVAGIPKWRISYLPRPGTDRVVTIRWSASTSNKVPVTDIASFHVHETRLDSLLNADVPAATDQKNPVPPDGFGSVWQEIREVRPVDPADAGRAVSDFAKPETWDRLPPVQAATIRWLTAQKVPQADMKAKSPGWYSWADSELAWVPANRRFADDLAKINDALTQPPQEYVLVSHSSDKPSALMISLSARYELGAYYARRKLHPWMQIVIGTLAMSGLPQHADNTGNEYARFEIEISQPKSPPRKNDGTLPDLAEWMQGDSAEADPLGWAALAKMGLATGISLRDPWTGDYLPQSEVRDFLNNAIKQTYKDVAYAEAILRVDSDIKIEIEIENKSNPNINDSVILSGHGTKAEMLNPDPDFLSLDVPLQAAWAVQAQPGKTDHDSLRALSMLQLSLRPYAIEMTPRSSLELGSDAEKFASPDEANYLTVEFDPKDKSAPKNEPNPKNEPGLEEDDLLPDADLQILNFGHVKGDGNKSTLMHYKKTAKENPKLDSLVNAGDRIIICHRHWSDDPSTSADWVFRKLFGKAYHEDAETDFGYFGKIGMKFELYKGLSKEPLFLLKNANQDDLRKSPWGRFSSKIFWTQYFFAPRGPDENGKNPDKHAPFLNIDGKEVDTTHLMFDRFMTHLTTAFAGEGGNEEPAAPDQSAEALRRKAYEKSTDLVEAYILWADRFFSSGPAIKRKSPETGSIIHTGQSPVHLTTVWPQRETPVRMAPDAMGRMQITHYINEDWASARSYAISRRHRWDDFFTPEDPVVFPKLDGKSGRTDIAIPRRRALQPAKLIGLRIIQSQSGQPFHEITLSEPSDLTLSKSNVTLARKLEFEALLRQFRLSFRHTKWATQLGITDARFPTGKDEDDTDVPDIAVEDAASDYLADTPRARLGAIRYQTPAEPYYYDQEMWHLTTATHVRSSESQIILPPPPAVAPQPVAGMGDAMKSFDVKWKDIDLPSQSFLSNNADKIKTTALSDNLQDFLQPQAQKFTLRMPRLLEALPEASHQGYQSAEIEEKSFGRIPDPSARLEIVDSGNGMRTTIATLVTIIAPNGGPQEPLELLTASNRHAVKATFPQPTLSSGLTAEVTIAHKMEASVDLTGINPPSFFNLPTEFVDWSFGDLSMIDGLPKLERMLHLVPLAMRLTTDIDIVGSPPKTISQFAPLTGPRWLFRPHLIGETGPATLEDHAYGIRLLVDLERRRTVSTLVASLSADAPFTRTALKHAEEARVALVSGLLDPDSIPTATEIMNEASLDKLLTYIVEPDGTLIGPNPNSDLLDNNLRLIVLLTPSATDNQVDQIVDLFYLHLHIGPHGATLATFDALSEVAETLAAGTYRPRLLDPLTVFAHHANIPSSKWGVYEKPEENDK